MGTTSSLTEVEVEHLFKIINDLRNRGCGIIYISHKMEEILQISDEITVMRDGAHVATAPAAAETGVDFMSFGCLTHSVPSLDLGLDFTVER